MKFHPAVINLAHHVGSFIEYWGFRSTDGKVWLLIYLADFPVDAKVLIENLNVSKGMISISINTLKEYQLIEELEYGDNRSKYYRAKFDPMRTITNVLAQREQVLMDEVVTSFDQIKNQKELEGVDPVRVKNIGRIIKFGQVLLSGVIRLKKLDLTPWK